MSDVVILVGKFAMIEDSNYLHGKIVIFNETAINWLKVIKSTTQKSRLQKIEKIQI